MSQWVVINRLMSREEAMRLWPDAADFTWCKESPPHYGGELWICCTRQRGHKGPHVDYHSGTVGYNRYLIWE